MRAHRKAKRSVCTSGFSRHLRNLSASTPYIWSLLHTFPRFKVIGKALCFTLIPSDDAHIDCIPPNIEYSQMGLPYPTLEIFAQSLLDTNDITAITGLIDGMDLTEQWGLEFLKLDAENIFSMDTAEK